MKKIISLLILLLALYGVSVFMLPGVASMIDSAIGMPGLSENIKG
jgi:hypothetical protein